MFLLMDRIEAIPIGDKQTLNEREIQLFETSQADEQVLTMGIDKSSRPNGDADDERLTNNSQINLFRFF
jgi:hypothetical protein